MSRFRDKKAELQELIEPDRSLRSVDDGIYSVLPDAAKRHHYDTMAKFYDLFMSTRVYHSVMWGSSPSAYVSFCRDMVQSDADGVMLDAGCGSMLFTASIYTETDIRIIGIDQSIGMLRKARARLRKLAGDVPQNVTLMQADLGDLPFLPGTFSSILCLNVLHLYEDVDNLMNQFRLLFTPKGKLRLTCLVRSGRFVGDRYVQILYKSGEFVRPRTAEEFSEIVLQTFKTEVDCTTDGNMAFISVNQNPG